MKQLKATQKKQMSIRQEQHPKVKELFCREMKTMRLPASHTTAKIRPIKGIQRSDCLRDPSSTTEQVTCRKPQVMALVQVGTMGAAA